MIHLFKFQDKLNKNDKNAISREYAEIKNIGKMQFLHTQRFEYTEFSRIKIIRIPSYFRNLYKKKEYIADIYQFLFTLFSFRSFTNLIFYFIVYVSSEITA